MTPSPCPALAAAASRLIGSPFRLHGRDPLTGLDCVGLVGAALEATGFRPTLPSGYSLRSRSVTQFLPYAERSGLTRVECKVDSGDVLLVAANPLQPHLVIATCPHAIVHADARAGCVVSTPLPASWPVLAHWRLNSKD